MQTHSYNLWWLRISTFLVAALAAASATVWVLKWTATAPPGSSAAATFSPAPPVDPQVVARLLGGGQASVAVGVSVPVDNAASRFKLTGVVADQSNGGYALIAVDGKPARPFRVGAQVEESLVLHSVSPRSAALAPRVDAPVSVTLDLPRLSPP